MCQKRRSQTVPSSAPGRLQAADPTDLHWASAANDRPMPRILQPTSPRSNSNWNSPREGESPSGSPRKERASRGRVVRGPRSDSGKFLISIYIGVLVLLGTRISPTHSCLYLLPDSIDGPLQSPVLHWCCNFSGGKGGILMKQITKGFWLVMWRVF